eukprot:TRINITY_DN61553_c0_g2_i2.p1 TRINITY_DN61553_c0_g2~~TRINITY_DN61553_c0_g2_i2.p1  ORF type:complete len:265 (+),score=64.85 TRINITY_DN61553_c0_g2_i2:76-795(+)
MLRSLVGSEMCIRDSDYTAMYTLVGLYQDKMGPEFQRNLQAVIIVHPSYSFKIATRFFAPFICDSLSAKLRFASSLGELESLLEFQHLHIPAFSLSQEEVMDTPTPQQPGMVGTVGMLPKIAHLVHSELESDFGEYLTAACSVLQENWKEFTRRGSLQPEVLEETRAALAAFDLEGEGNVAVDDLRYCLGTLGDSPLVPDELDELLNLAQRNKCANSFASEELIGCLFYPPTKQVVHVV